MFSRFLSLVALLSACATSGSNLGVVPRAGQVVAVRMPNDGGEVKGRVTSIDADSITIEASGGSYRLASSALADARVATGRKRAVAKGAAIGALIGSVTGLAFGIAEEKSYDCSTGCLYEGLAVWAGLVFGAMTGSTVGAMVGATKTTPIWSSARLPGPTARFTADLVTGDVVRLSDSESAETAVIVGGSGDEARIRFESGVETVVGVESIERFMGNRSRGGRGILYGAAAGALLGTVSYLLENDPYSKPTSGTVAAGILFLSAVGATAGAALTATPVPTWSTPASVPASTLSLRPILTWDRLGVVGRFSF